MNIFKRGILSLLRRPKRTVLLILLMLFIGNIYFLTSLFYQSFQQIQNLINQQMISAVTIVPSEKRLENEEKDNYITDQDVKYLGQLSQVEYYDYSLRLNVEIPNIIKVKQENTDDFLPTNNISYFSVIGVENEIFSDLKQEKIYK